MKIATICVNGKEVAEVVMEDDFLSAAIRDAVKNTLSASSLPRECTEMQPHTLLPGHSLIFNGAI